MSMAIWIVLHSAEVVHFTHTTCFALTPARDQRAYTQFLRCVGKLTWQSCYISRTQNMLHDRLPEYRGSVHLTGLATPTPTSSSSTRAVASSRADWLNKLRLVPIWPYGCTVILDENNANYRSLIEIRRTTTRPYHIGSSPISSGPTHGPYSAPSLGNHHHRPHVNYTF